MNIMSLDRYFGHVNNRPIFAHSAIDEHGIISAKVSVGDIVFTETEARELLAGKLAQAVDALASITEALLSLRRGKQ